MNKIDFLFSGLLIIGFASLFGLTMLQLNSNNDVNLRLINSIDKKLSLIGNDVDLIGNDVDFLYSFADLTKNGKPYINGNGSVLGINRHNKYLLVVTGDRTNHEICKTFLHELGHENCKDLYDDGNEECANKYSQENLYRCNDV